MQWQACRGSGFFKGWGLVFFFAKASHYIVECKPNAFSPTRHVSIAALPHAISRPKLNTARNDSSRVEISEHMFEPTLASQDWKRGPWS